MKLPEDLLHKISEFSSGGFGLFLVQDHGVDSYLWVDNQVIKDGLSNHIIKVLSMQQEIDDQMMFDCLISEAEAAERSERKKRKKGGKGGDGPPFA